MISCANRGGPADRGRCRRATESAPEEDTQQGKAKNGKGLARLDAQRRHKLRIQARRSATPRSFFAGVFPASGPRSGGRILAALERLQDGLGELNDIVCTRSSSLRWACGAGAPSRKRPRRRLADRAPEDARLDAAMAAADHGLCGMGEGQALLAIGSPCLLVIAGLDPAIHLLARIVREADGPAGKPAG